MFKSANFYCQDLLILFINVALYFFTFSIKPMKNETNTGTSNTFITKTIKIELTPERLVNTLACYPKSTREEIESQAAKDHLDKKGFTSAMILEDDGAKEFLTTIKLATDAAIKMFPEIPEKLFNAVYSDKCTIK